MNNLSSYCGLVDAKIRASDKDLPVQKLTQNDLAFVRKGYALEKKIPKMKESRGLEVTADIHYWTTGHDILAQIEKKLESV